MRQCSRGLLAMALTLAAVSPLAALSDKEILAKYGQCVVKIETQSPQGAGTGTGFFINGYGSILTCAHVVAGASSVTVRYKGEKKSALILYYNANLDQAILQILERGMPYVAMKFVPGTGKAPGGPEVEKLDQLMAMGYPLGMDDLNVTVGRVTAIYDDDKAKYVYQSDVVINPGNSGGPVFDKDGYVVGVATSKVDKTKYPNVEGMNFVKSVIPIKTGRNAPFFQSWYDSLCTGAALCLGNKELLIDGSLHRGSFYREPRVASGPFPRFNYDFLLVPKTNLQKIADLASVNYGDLFGYFMISAPVSIVTWDGRSSSLFFGIEQNFVRLNDRRIANRSMCLSRRVCDGQTRLDIGWVGRQVVVTFKSALPLYADSILWNDSGDCFEGLWSDSGPNAFQERSGLDFFLARQISDGMKASLIYDFIDLASSDGLLVLHDE